MCRPPVFNKNNMTKLDPKFTEQLVAWMKEDHSSDEKIREGAMLLLKLNRNRVLYQQIVRTPQRLLKKLEYEIKKHINIRLDGYTLDDVKEMALQVMPHIQASAETEVQADNLPIVEGQEGIVYPKVKVLGKRPDHDMLPPEIQKLWTDNAERWKKIKEKFELCKTLNEPCDLYEHLKILKEAWYKYKKDMAAYDGYIKVPAPGTADAGGASGDADKSAVDVAQSYISRYLPVLLELAMESRENDFPEEKAMKLEDLRMKIQDRVYTLLDNNVEISDQRKAELASVDIKLEKEEENPENNAEGEKSE